VSDDGGSLPGGRDAPLAGVRVEVLDGPKTGTFSTTDGTGTYRLPRPGLGIGAIALRATKEGFDADSQPAYPELFVAPRFRLGQRPHTLWGDVVLAGTAPAVSVSNVQLEILDGPNAGRTAMGDASGRYRFDDLLASPRFSLRLSKAGHQTRTYAMVELRSNQQHNLQIESE
jgi:hypothetical protein